MTMSALRPIVPAIRRRFPCHLCEKSYNSAGSLKDHLNAKHYNIRPHGCTYCDRSFIKVSLLQRHIAWHRGYRPYTCDLCHKSFVSKFGFTKHQLVHTGEKPFHCTICGRQFASKSNMLLHTSKHAGLHPWVCEQCGKRFTVKTSLQTHRATVHNGEKAYECEQCGRRFSQGTNLRSHMKRHNEVERPFQCAWCDRRFKDERWKGYHEKTHFMDLPSMCTVCGKRFQSDSHLGDHMRVHTKAFACQYCGKRFNRPNQRDRHSVRHKGVYECTDCDKKFDTSEYLAKHLLFVHGTTRDWGDKKSQDPSSLRPTTPTVNGDVEPEYLTTPTKKILITEEVRKRSKFECRYCLKRFKYFENLQQHMTVCSNRLFNLPLDDSTQMKHDTSYRLNCNKDSESFRTESNLIITHVMSMNDTDDFIKSVVQEAVTLDPELIYSCDRCDKRFATERSAKMHQLMHADSADEFKMFACTECEMRFSWHSLLDGHLQSIHRKVAPQINSSDRYADILNVSDSSRNIDCKVVHSYVCMYCVDRFEHIYQFYNHLSSVHLENNRTVLDTVDIQTDVRGLPGDGLPDHEQPSGRSPVKGRLSGSPPDSKRLRGRPPGGDRSRGTAPGRWQSHATLLW